MTNSSNKKIAELPQYYNRFDAAQGFDETLFLAGRGLQSAELNELQSMGISRIQGIGDALFQEGDVISGAACVMDAETGEATIESGKIYLQGAVRSVDAAEFTLPLKGTVQLGVRVQTKVVTELNDPSLRDPALGCRNYQEAGAARLRRTTAWTYEVIDGLDLGNDLNDVRDSEKNNNPQETPNTPENNPRSKNDGAENSPDDDSHLTVNGQDTSHFYPIYRVVNGVLVQHNAPPQSDAFEKTLALYDYASHGHYVIDGLTVRLLPSENNNVTGNAPLVINNDTNDNKSPEWTQTVMVSEGKAHVNGFTVQFSHPLLVDFPLELDVAEVLAEPHPFVADSTGKMTVNLHHAPVAEIQRVEITQEKTVTVTRTSDVSAVDALPDTVVMAVLRIAQGAVVFRPNSDYRFEAGRINWSIGGKTPLSGSQYTVLCQVRESVTPGSVTENSFSVHGAVKDSLVLVDYTRYLPRIDAIVLDAKGNIARLKGTATDSTQAILPSIPPEVFALAFIHQTGSRLSSPRVENSAVQRISMAALRKLSDLVDDLYAKVAELMLGNAASQETPAVKKGLLVDAFLNESLRDAGFSQSGALVGGCLTLPIVEKNVKVSALESKAIPQGLLPFTAALCHGQSFYTAKVSVNRLKVMEALPADAVLLPPIEQWQQIPASPWTSALTQRFDACESDYVKIDNPNRDASPVVHPQRLQFQLMGFEPTESITVSVNGRNVRLSSEIVSVPMASTRLGNFTVSMAAGCQRVQFFGNQSHFAETAYWAQPVRDAAMRRVTGYTGSVRQGTSVQPRRDALTQTFRLSEGAHSVGVMLWIRQVGKTPLSVTVRDTNETGQAGRAIYAKALLLPERVNVQRSRVSTTCVSWSPVWLSAERDYALVLHTLDTDWQVGFAQAGRRHTGVPYHTVTQSAVSNGRLFQGEAELPLSALSYELLRAHFSQLAGEIALGEVTLNQASNVILLAAVDRVTPKTQCRFHLVDPKTHQACYSLTENTPLALPDTVSGTFELRAQLSGSATESPVIYSGIQFAQASISQSGDYVTRLITAGSNSHVTITYEADLGDDTSGDGTVEAFVEASSHQFEAAALQSTRAVDKNWVERIHTFSPLNRSETRIKLVLQGSAKCRTKVRRLRVVIT